MREQEARSMNRRVLVTGDQGFLGQGLTEYLCGKNKIVIGYDIATGQDITDFEQLHSTFVEYKPDLVFHLAAQAFVGKGESDPYHDLRVNGVGMLNVLRCVEEFGVDMVFTSSGAVYGITTHVLHNEHIKPGPIANYGCTKRLAELYLQKWVIKDNVYAMIARFSSVYGPGRGKHGAVNAFIELALEGKPLTVHGDGSQTRDMIYRGDAIRGLELVMDAGRPGEIYNIGCGKGHSVKDVAEIVSDLTGAEIVYDVEPEFSKFNVKHNKFDVTKAFRELNFRPEYDLFEGIKHTLEEERTLRKVA